MRFMHLFPSLITSASGLGLALASKNQLLRIVGLTLSFAPSTYFLSLYIWIKRFFWNYFQKVNAHDMEDPVRYYRLVDVTKDNSGSESGPVMRTSGASALWVAEVETKEGWKLVGTVGLGELYFLVYLLN
jgi:hypothetical protein